jgi:acetamidase/formamidase/AraC-like DNA-binding protein
MVVVFVSPPAELISMVVQRFSTEAFPLAQRPAAWSEALRAVELDAMEATGGRLALYHPAAGHDCVLMIAGPQSLLRVPGAKVDHAWLGLLLEGVAMLANGDATRGQELLCWPSASGALLAPAGRFRLLLLRRPQSDPAWGGALPAQDAAAGDMPVRIGGQSVLIGLLATIAQAMDAGHQSTLAALDTALAEIMPEALGVLHRGGPQQAGLRRRILRGIERRLDDPHLNLARFAEAEAVSERAVKKLLDSQGESFSHYLRDRRLEQAAKALSDPGLRTVPVAEIGFRCGFSEPAHFSRAFRQRHGMAPNAYRARASAQSVMPPPEGPRSRGHPQPGSRAANPPNQPVRLPATIPRDAPAHHHLRATPRTVHWGFFSNTLPPALVVRSGDTVTVETLTQHASDDPARMIGGDADAEAVFHWTATHKAIDRRGAGPMDASIYGRGAGEGFGVHILTGPIMVEGAQPGDVLEVEILDLAPRPSRAPDYAGRCFASNAATWWGRHYDDLLTGPRPREVVTIYEIVDCGGQSCAHALHSFRWTPQRDPFGVLHKTMDYPGVLVDPASIEPFTSVLRGIHVPLRLHFGTIGLAPDHPGPLDSVPPSAFGGNIDNWRFGVGDKLYLPVAVAGALLSLGDPHAAQGDGEISGTAMECSLTGTLRLRLHRRASATEMLRDLDYPLIETATAWIIQGFSFADYLADLGEAAQSEIYRRSSLDAAMRDAFRKARRFLITARGLTEDEAISLLSVAVDFGITQVVDGNWGVHAIIAKALFNPARESRR